MTRSHWFPLIFGFVLSTLLLDACSFTVQVVPPASASPTLSPDSPSEIIVPPTVIAPSATPTLIPISIDLLTWLEVFNSFGQGEITRSLEFSSDGNVVASAAGNTEDFDIHLWDVASGQALHHLSGHTDIVWDLAFSPDGMLLASVSNDGTARIWDWRNGSELRTLQFPGEVVNVSFSPAGDVLAVGGVDEMHNQIQNASIWTFAVDSWEALQKFPEYLSIGAMAYSPDGSLLVGGGTSRNVQVWDARDGDLLFTLNHAHQVTHASVSPDGSTLATATCATVENAECAEGGMWLWDLTTGRLRKRVAGFSGPLQSVVYSPDGSFLIAGTRDGLLRAFTTTDYEPWFESPAPGGVGAMAFSPDGRLLATGDAKGEVHLWKVVYRP